MSEAGLKDIEKQVPGDSRAGLLRRIPWGRIGMPAVLVILCILFGAINPNFWSVINLTNVSRQISILALISIGQTFAILSAGIDLSVGSLLALVSVVAAQQMLNFGLWGGIAAGILAGQWDSDRQSQAAGLYRDPRHVDRGARRCPDLERRAAGCRLASRLPVSRRG
jgi:hypothetical protein